MARMKVKQNYGGMTKVTFKQSVYQRKSKLYRNIALTSILCNITMLAYFLTTIR